MTNNKLVLGILAHVDAGKTTLAEGILYTSGQIRNMGRVDHGNTFLDTYELEKSRGITIFSKQALFSSGSKEFTLLDTPGHVDFSYEVSRSLAACEGALLVVDAAQGVEAQTLANLYLALDNNLTVIPVINKIDLPSADVEKVTKELENIGFSRNEIVCTSAKTGVGIEELLEKIVEIIPAPKGDVTKPLKALIFDSLFDSYRGVITSIRVMDGEVKVGDLVRMMETNAVYDIIGISINTPKEKQVKSLKAGDVGYL